MFCALDADDRLASTWFEKGMRVLGDQPNIAFVSHWLETFGDEHWTWKPERATCRRCWRETPSMGRRSSAGELSRRSAAMTKRCARAARIGISGSVSSSEDSPDAGAIYLSVEEAHLKWMMQKLGDGGTFLDVGAATGATTLPIAVQLGNKVRIVSVRAGREGSGAPAGHASPQ